MICHKSNIIKKSDENSAELCKKALLENKTIIIPTDTVYGFSALVNSQNNEKIMNIKGRSETKPFIQLIGKPQDISKYTRDTIPENLLNYWPGPLTIIVNDLRLEGQKNTTTAFRCPGDKWLREILSNLDEPLYSTSVNRSGSPVLDTEESILKEFSEEVDLIVLDGDKKNALPSTIVLYSEKGMKVLREGAVSIKIN